MVEKAKGIRIKWYRSPVSREDLAALNRRSDFWGFLQTGGYLGLLAATAFAAVYSIGRLPWPVTVLIFFFHGTCWHFMVNGFHELVHESVFRTRWLNGIFLRIFSFLGWYNHVHFWASHTEHHKFTLHPPDDLEVVLPIPVTLKGFLKGAIVNPMGLWHTVKGTVRHAAGGLKGEWEIHLFGDNPALHRRMRNWARFLLLGHGAVLVTAIVTGWWWLPLVITLAPFYGGWLHFFCNSSQHIGLRDNVPDFRLCCRTIYLNPFFQFLYWHMNYHTEHHMYAAVPCYNLGKLHRLIRHDLPPTAHGLIPTWRQIIGILRRQKVEPGYQYTPELPAPSRDPEQSTPAPQVA